MDYPDYNPQLDSPPLADPELDALDTLLRSLPSEAAMNIEGLDGYLSALAAGPPTLGRLRSADWMPVIWGGDGAGSAPFASQKQRKRAVVLVLRHLHATQRRLREAPQDWEPVLSVAETAERELVDAEDWCIGFLQAVALDPAAWAPLFEDAVLGPALAPIARLGGEGGELDDAGAEERDVLSRAAVEAVALLCARPGR